LDLLGYPKPEEICIRKPVKLTENTVMDFSQSYRFSDTKSKKSPVSVDKTSAQNFLNFIAKIGSKVEIC
jgi:hypothetical protein